MHRHLLLMLAVGSLAACGTLPPSGEISSAPGVCTLRAIVIVRSNANIRNDSEFVELMDRLGLDVEVIYNMSRNARMVRVRAEGPDEACQEVLNELRLDPRIESANSA